MDPQYLLIEDFMSHRRTEIDCTQFDVALIIGQGKSNPRESNGVGKSVVYHAIRYALFGVYPTSVVDKIVRDGADGCKVTYDFKLGTRIFRVERSRKNGKPWLSLKEKINDKWPDDQNKAGKKTQKTTTETHDELLKLIKLNDNAFNNSVLFSQNDLKGLASAKSPDERKIILKDALGLSYYKKLEEMVKKVAADILKEIEIHRAIVYSLGSPKEELKTLNLNLNNSKNIISQKEKEKEKLYISLESKRSELVNLQRLISLETLSAYNKLIDIKNNKKQTNEEIKQTQNIIEANNAKILSLSNSLMGKENELKKIQDRCDELRAQNVRPIVKIQQDLDSVSENELNGRAYVGTLESKLIELRKPIPDDKECPTCHQEITDEYKLQYQQTTRTRLVDLEVDLADKRKKLKAVSSKKLRLKNELDEFNRVIVQIASLENTLLSKKTEMQYNIDYIERIKKLNDAKSGDLELLNRKLDELVNLEKSLTDMVKDLSADDINSKILSVKNEVDLLERQLEIISKEISFENQNIGMYLAKIDVKNKNLDNIKDESKIIEKYQKKYKIYKKVQKSFGSNGIPALIINTILDDLQIEANIFLAKLKPGLEVQFAENLDLFFRIHGAEREYEQLSGGQMMLFAFALKLGLSVIIQRRLGVDIKLLLLDEVDQSLDDASKDAYVDVVKKLQDQFKILIITHDNRLKNKFNTAIVVEGDPINGALTKLVSW